MASRGLPLYVALLETTRQPRVQRCCTDEPAEPARSPRRRVRKLATAVSASLTVFVKLVRRPVGGTTVVLVPSDRVPDASGTVMVSDDWLPRAS